MRWWLVLLETLSRLPLSLPSRNIPEVTLAPHCVCVVQVNEGDKSDDLIACIPTLSCFVVYFSMSLSQSSFRTHLKNSF